MMVSPGCCSSDVTMREDSAIIDIDMLEDPAVSCSDYTQDIFVYLREAEVTTFTMIITIITLASL